MKPVKLPKILSILGLTIVTREYWKEKMIAKHALLKIKKYEHTLLWMEFELKKWEK